MAREKVTLHTQDGERVHPRDRARGEPGDGVDLHRENTRLVPQSKRRCKA